MIENTVQNRIGTKEWIRADGRIIKISDMESSHIVNSLCRMRGSKTGALGRNEAHVVEDLREELRSRLTPERWSEFSSAFALGSDREALLDLLRGELTRRAAPI